MGIKYKIVTERALMGTDNPANYTLVNAWEFPFKTVTNRVVSSIKQSAIVVTNSVPISTLTFLSHHPQIAVNSIELEMTQSSKVSNFGGECEGSRNVLVVQDWAEALDSVHLYLKKPLLNA
eukprot:CAMPEP_0184032916 /NCGR_PEP_ID=MMETSP0955-20130417/3400_1 /TAXON_ID=627963 /ORGANISM="Aplanochytrium sp, Strain PBS07" /LENGTH=120 /DNA_ID=CAMNT_0026319149 /DNA_START=19 /DNA_END=381 /DNA_ORIENTATION=-